MGNKVMEANHHAYSAKTFLPMSDELSFLKKQTGEDEAEILVKALNIGLNMLYSQTVERLFIDEELSREKTLEILGAERIDDVEYAKQALEKDIVQGLSFATAPNKSLPHMAAYSKRIGRRRPCQKTA